LLSAAAWRGLPFNARL